MFGVMVNSLTKKTPKRLINNVWASIGVARSGIEPETFGL